MAINISQAFHRTSAAAIDDTLTLTKAEMLTVNDNLMPAKYLTVCQDDGKIYLYDKSVTPSQETGKFSVFEGGGSGVSSYNDLTDKPSMNGNVLTGNKTNSQLGIPTALSEMTDDATHRTVTDTQITGWSGKQNAITAGTNLAFDGNTLNASIPVLGTINRSDIYDTTEKVIGKWTDGRPLYQKSVNFGGLPNTTEKSIDHNISNLLNVVSIKAIAYLNNSALTIPDISEINNAINFIRVLCTSGNKIQIITTRDYSAFSAIVTLQYTKTTDAANSYNYADENDYSTSEKIIGKWIDGKTLYQKTIDFGALPNATRKAVNHDISGISKIVDVSTICDDGSVSYILPWVAKSTNGENASVYVTSTQVVVNTSNDASGATAYVTLKYTKTTD